MAWQLTISPGCIGSGVCAGTAPHHFTLGEDGHARPLSETVAPDDAILDAAVSCPMEAIAVTDTDTGIRVYS